MLRLASIVAAVFAVIQASQLVASEEPEFKPGQIEFFETHVRPLLVAHCYDCHSTDAAELEAELYVDTRQGMLEGGESGPAVIPGKPDESPLIAAVKYESTEMPPDRKLAPQQIEALATWVEIGAPWPASLVVSRLADCDEGYRLGGSTSESLGVAGCRTTVCALS